MIAGTPIASSSVADAPSRFKIVAYLKATQGAYTVTGQSVDLLYDRLLEATQGSYTLTGQDVNLRYVIAVLEAQQGTYSITGQDVDLLWHHVLVASQGAYTLTGQDVDLTRGLARAKWAKISVSRDSGTQATVTLENFESGDKWNIYRVEIDSDGKGTFSKIKDSHASATYTDSGLTSGKKYKWKAAITFDLFGEQEKSQPKRSIP